MSTSPDGSPSGSKMPSAFLQHRPHSKFPISPRNLPFFLRGAVGYLTLNAGEKYRS